MPVKARPVAHRLVCAVLAFTFVITLAMTAIQTLIVYRREISSLHENIKRIKEEYIPSVTASLWIMDKEQLQLELEGILNIRHIEYLRLQREGGDILSSGRLKSRQTMTYDFPLYYRYNGQVIKLGTLQVVAELDTLRKHLFYMAFVRLLYEGAQIFFISFFIVYLVQSLITRHLADMAGYVSTIRPGVPGGPFILRRRRDVREDELDRVVSAINEMEAQLHQYIQRQKSMEVALIERENRLRTILDSEPECVMLIADDFTLIDINPAGAAMCEAEAPDRVIGKSVLDKIDFRHASPYRELMQRVFKGESGALELEIIGSRGTHRWVDLNAVPMRGRDGRVSAVLGIAREITERKLAGDQLQLFRTLIDQASDAIFVIDPETARFLDVNAKSCENLGYTRDELLKMCVYDIETMIPDVRSWGKRVSKVKHEGQGVREGRQRRKDGSTFPVEANVNYITHAQRDYFIAVIRDVSDRKEREEELRSALESAEQEKAKSNAIIAAMGDAITIQDTDFRIIYQNHVQERMTGNHVGEYCYRVYEGKERTCEGCALAMSFTDGGIHKTERAVPSDGGIKYLELTTSALKNHEGKIIAGIELVRDITERKRSEDALNERAKLLALGADIGEALARGGTMREMLQRCTVIIVDRLDGAFARIWTLNEKENILELQASAGIYTHLDGPHGRIPVGELKIGIIASERRAHLTNSVIGDPSVNNQEWAKTEGMVAFAGHPLMIGDRLLGVMAMFSRRRLSEETLNEMATVATEIAMGIDRQKSEEQIRESLREKEVLLKEVHHRVKNNLQIISSMLNLQSEQAKDRQVLDLLTETRNRVKSMALVHEKLYQSRDLGKINVADYAVSLIKYLFSSYNGSSSGIALKIEMKEFSLDIDKAVYCGLIVNELVSNSLKYAFPSGSDRQGGRQIAVRLNVGIDALATIVVSDNGEGFPEKLDFRNTSSLGLQLVCLLTEQIGGTIDLDRSTGTSFKISFKTR